MGVREWLAAAPRYEPIRLVEAWDVYERALAERPVDITTAIGDSQPTSFSALYTATAVAYFTALVGQERWPCPHELAEGAGEEFLAFTGLALPAGHTDVVERTSHVPPLNGVRHRKVFRGSVFRHPDVDGVCVLWRWYATESIPEPG
jgi:hypothetical protein